MKINRETADHAFEILSALTLDLGAVAEEIAAELTFEQAVNALLYISEGYVGMFTGLARAAGQDRNDVLRRLAALRQQPR